MKKIAALLVTIVFAAVAVFLMPRLREEFSPEPLAPSSPPMRLARYYWPGQFWKEIAQDRGWFAEAGLAVELVDTNPDYYASLDAMVAGALDENDFTLFDAVHYQAKGADLVIILNTANSTGVDGIVGRRELKGIDDLRGRTIGVSRNTYLQYLLQEVLLRHRLSLEDVRLQDMPTEKAVVAFAEGSLDAVVAWEPLLGKAAAQGNGHLLFNTSKMVNSLPGVSVVRRQFVEERPADIQRFVTVWKRTVSYMEENPDEA
ncbi:ABC transporter substrate-binding protein, partial [Patescibacteria group bacterium]|nr:ABC transporter substrate-binding protein [Patescibacteria group bacterium]